MPSSINFSDFLFFPATFRGSSIHASQCKASHAEGPQVAPEDLCHQYEYLILKESNPGKLMKLFKQLSVRNSLNMQVLINEYFREVTTAESSFILSDFSLVDDIVVNVVGNEILNPDIRIDTHGYLMDVLSKENEAVIINEKCLPCELIDAINRDLSVHKNTGTLREVLFVPIFIPIEDRPTFWVGLANPKHLKETAQSDVALVSECLRYCVALLKNMMRYEEMRSHHLKAKQLIDAIMTCAPLVGNMTKLTEKIKAKAKELFGCELGAIYLKESSHLVSRTTHYGTPFDFKNFDLYDIVIPVGTGVTGMSALTRSIISSKDPYKDKYFCNNLDKFTGNKTRNMLSFPLTHQDTIMGIMDVLNKIDGPHFIKLDEVYALHFGKICGSLIHHGLNLRHLCENFEKKRIVNSFLLRHVKACEEDVHQIFRLTDVPEIETYQSDEFLPNLAAETDTILIIMNMFSHLNMFHKFNIDPIKLLRFILSVKRSHNVLPFFNWFHTFSTVHFAFLMLTNHKLVQNEYLREIEGLAYLLAVLCHHMDYRGSTSCFQLTSGTVLESLYSSPGCISRHHVVAQTLRLINEPGCTILENFDDEQYKTFISTIERMILATDIAEYEYAVPKIDELLNDGFEFENDEHRLLFQQLLMACTEISDHARPWKHCRDAGAKLINEFMRLLEESFADGVFCLPDLEYRPKIAEANVLFINTIVQPAFTLLLKFIKSTEVFANNSRINAEAWQLVRSKLKKDKSDKLDEIYATDVDELAGDDQGGTDDDIDGDDDDAFF